MSLPGSPEILESMCSLLRFMRGGKEPLSADASISLRKTEEQKNQVAKSASSLHGCHFVLQETLDVETLIIERNGTTNVAFGATGIKATSKQTEAADLLCSSLMCHKGICPETILRRCGGSARNIISLPPQRCKRKTSPDT